VAKNTSMSVCTLRWFISVDVPFLKNPYGSVKITIYFEIINLVGNYMVVDELKSPHENKSFKKIKCTCYCKIKLKSTKSDYDIDL
jgi:hypothetical protein